MPDQRLPTTLRKLWQDYGWLIGIVLLFGLLALVGLLASGAGFTPGNYLLAVGAVLGVAGLWIGQMLVIGICLGTVTRWRRRRTIAAGARRRPGAVFVPGHAGHGMYSRAEERGVLPRVWRRTTQSDRQIVLAVLPDRVEVWAYRVREPLWSVHRVEHGVRIERVRVLSGESDIDRDELWFDDGTASAGVAPEYAVRLLLFRDYPTLDLERALREIGLSPDAVPRLDRSAVSGGEEPGQSER